MINPMIYRVFLQDEKDAPSPSGNSNNIYRIRSGESLALYHNCPPGWFPSLEQQLPSMDCGSYVGPSSEPLDGHWLIDYDGITIGIVHTLDEISVRSYELAKKCAKALAESLSKKEGRPYVFIDLTSRGDKGLAERLSRTVHNVVVPNPSPRSVDIGE